MTVNLGTLDRLFRFLMGMVLIGLPLTTSFAVWSNPVFQFGAPLVGVVLVTTALVRFCPIYRLFGVRTCRV
ncbi:MAG: DUF2892 domain-containing protein [Geminicoccaceae bacterium]